ncbi:MAG: ABC transporter substrate-binding protein [Candidatus Zixiibacteriota bacterium]
MRTGPKQILWLFICALLVLPAAVSQASDEIAIGVLMSDSLKATMRTLSGADKVVSGSHPNAVFHTFLINQSPEQDELVIDSLRHIGPKLLLTIGSAATQFAKQHFADIPTVFAAVMYPELSGFVRSASEPGGNITGASLDIPVKVQFKYFKQIVPNLKFVGVLYTDSTASLIPPARATAWSLGLTLIAIKVSDIKELPGALDSIASASQGIWSLADPNLFDPQTTRYILLNTMRKGIPFMGFSRHVVESGALFALDFDYKAVGRQAGEIVNRVIEGEPPSSIHVTSADIIWFHYNEKTAQHLDVTIPPELAAVAKEVYR